MPTIRGGAYAIAAAVKKPLQLPVSQINTTVPAGARFRLDYVLVSWPRIMSSDEFQILYPNLSFDLYDSGGHALTVGATDIATALTPGGQDTGISFPFPPGGYSKGGVRGLPRFGIEYAPLTVIRMDIRGQTGNPPWVSITYLGMRDQRRW